MAKKNRKIRKKRGLRSRGWGSHKKARGAGSKGGAGMAGGHKGKWTWIIKHDPDHFGRRGFIVPEEVKSEVRSVNLDELERMIEKAELGGREIPGIAREKEGFVVNAAEMNIDKILGKGRVSRPLTVKARSFSKNAQKKIEGAGGKAVPVGD